VETNFLSKAFLYLTAIVDTNSDILPVSLGMEEQSLLEMLRPFFNYQKMMLNITV
jgi:hypothetical protein